MSHLRQLHVGRALAVLEAEALCGDGDDGLRGHLCLGRLLLPNNQRRALQGKRQLVCRSQTWERLFHLQGVRHQHQRNPLCNNRRWNILQHGRRVRHDHQHLAAMAKVEKKSKGSQLCTPWGQGSGCRGLPLWRPGLHLFKRSHRRPHRRGNCRRRDGDEAGLLLGAGHRGDHVRHRRLHLPPRRNRGKVDRFVAELDNV